MSDNKKYYYLRVKENFYDSDEMIILESMPDGFLYSNILIKLYLRSLKNNGKLMFNDRIPFNSEMLSKITRHPVAVVEKAVSIFKEMNLIDVLDNGAIFMLDIESFIGKSNTEADRKRDYRRRIEKEKQKILLGHLSGQMSDERPPELEIEKELEIELDTKANKSPTKAKRFVKPTLSEIEQYCIERNNNVNAEQFFDYYESNGWKVGKNSMKDWKAAVRTWEKNNYNKPAKSNKQNAIDVVNKLMREYGGEDEQSTTDSESTIDVTASVQY